MAKPTTASVLKTIAEFKRLGKKSFLETYGIGRGAVSYYVEHDGGYFDLKAIYAVAHTPPVSPRSFYTGTAVLHLRKLGFTIVDTDEIKAVPLTKGQIEGTKEYQEGKRTLREIAVIQRSTGLRDKAKDHYGDRCMACDFSFGERYGAVGKGYIEVHHVRPLSMREAEHVARLDDVIVLCANCHRIVHLANGEPFTLDQLQSMIREAKKGLAGKAEG